MEKVKVIFVKSAVIHGQIVGPEAEVKELELSVEEAEFWISLGVAEKPKNKKSV